MDPYGGPAALGGVVTGLMLVSWMLGRWQSGPSAARLRAVPEALAEPPEAPAATRACEAAARAERRDAVDSFAALGELHADVSAYRAAQQILSDSALRATMRVGWTASGEGEMCRFVGVSGAPTCPGARSSAGPARACAACNAAPIAPVPEPDRVLPLAQPSAEPVVFTRV
jgi:hypothetical protein